MINENSILQLTVKDFENILKKVVTEVLEKNAASNQKEILSTNELLDWLGCSLSFINKLKREHKIPFYRAGSRIFFKRNEVASALRESSYNKIKALL